MAGWIHVTAIPNKPDMPRARFLINLDKIFGFNQTPGNAVQVWFSPNANEPALSVVESMAEIELQLDVLSGLRPRTTSVDTEGSAQPRYGAWEHVSDVLGRAGVDTYDGGEH